MCSFVPSKSVGPEWSGEASNWDRWGKMLWVRRIDSSLNVRPCGRRWDTEAGSGKERWKHKITCQAVNSHPSIFFLSSHSCYPWIQWWEPPPYHGLTKNNVWKCLYYELSDLWIFECLFVCKWCKNSNFLTVFLCVNDPEVEYFKDLPHSSITALFLWILFEFFLARSFWIYVKCSLFLACVLCYHAPCHHSLVAFLYSACLCKYNNASISDSVCECVGGGWK